MQDMNPEGFQNTIPQELLSAGDILMALMQTNPHAMFVLDRNGVVILSNAVLAQRYGVKLEDLIGRSIYEFMPPELVHSRKQKIDEAFETKRPLTMVDSREGRFYEAQFYPIVDSQGTVKYLAVIAIDVTEKVKALEELQFERSQLLSIFNSIDADIYISDPTTYEILFVNQHLRNRLGRDVIGSKCYKEFQRLDHPCDFCTNPIILKNKGEAYRWEYHNPIFNRDYFLIDRIIKWPDGRDVRLEIALDVTKVKELENQLLQAQKMEAIGRLAGGIAHDFNNMLTVIKGMCQLSLLKVNRDNPIYDKLKQIEAAADKAEELTSQLLAFGRKQVMEMKVFSLNKIVMDMENMLRRLIGEQIDLITMLDPNLCQINADPSKITQVILNLVVNAKDSMPQGGKIIIETKTVLLDEDFVSKHVGAKCGCYAMLSVSDTGVGIPKDVQAHIFEPFFTTKELGKGTGLGLATVYGIVKQSGGNIYFSSEEGSGTTFTIYLPCVDEAAPSLAEEEKRASPKGGETILVVEDNEIVREVATSLLSELGYKVLEASNQDEAESIAKNTYNPIDLILTDVLLKDTNGLQLYESLKKIQPNLKVVFMSGYPENVITHHGVLMEGLDFIQKPFNLNTLAEKIRQVLDRDNPTS